MFYHCHCGKTRYVNVNIKCLATHTYSRQASTYSGPSLAPQIQLQTAFDIFLNLYGFFIFFFPEKAYIFPGNTLCHTHGWKQSGR